MLYAFIFYRQLFDKAISNVVDKVFDYRMLTLYTDRIADIMTADSEKCQKTISKSRPFIHRVSSIRAVNLSFQYGKELEPLFANVNFTVNQGESLALKAPSGFGKTTLLKILMGLLEPTGGRVLVDQQPLNSIKKTDYREKIASVMQDDTLFSGTLYQNICFFDDNVNTEMVVQSAKIAGIHNEIEKMPMGYNSLIGDMGTILSGGQKQRILLARAIYSKPDILFLDEATSHLDREKEDEINSAIKRLNIIKIFVAHRIETLKMADRVIDISLSTEKKFDKEIDQNLI